ARAWGNGVMRCCQVRKARRRWRQSEYKGDIPGICRRVTHTVSVLFERGTSMASIEQLKAKLTEIFRKRLDQIFSMAGTAGSLSRVEAWNAVSAAMSALKAGADLPPAGASVSSNSCRVIDPVTGNIHCVGDVSQQECEAAPPNGLGG